MMAERLLPCFKGFATLAIVGLIGVLPLFMGRFYVVLVTEMIIWGLFALSFNLIYGYTGMLSFGQSIFFGIGAYFLVYGARWGLPLPMNLFLLTLAAGILGVGVGTAVIRVRGAKFFLVTLVGAILFHLIALDNRWLTGGDDGFIVSAAYLGIRNNFYLVYGVSLVVGLTIAGLVRSRLGLAFRMIRDDQKRAELLGYWTDGFKVLSFSLGGAIAGLAGGLYGYTSGFVSADYFHWSHSANAVIWTVLGGSGTVAGPFIGAALLTWLREGLSALWGKVYPVVVGILLIVLVVGLPEGIVGMFQGVAEKLKGSFFEER